MHSDEPRVIHWRRFLASLLLGELVPVLALVAAVAVAGPAEPTEAVAFARNAGTWIGPLVGSTTILLLAAWAGLASARPAFQGFLIGSILALVDATLLIAMSESFSWVFLASNLGRVAAGITGGWIASRSSHHVLGPRRSPAS